MTSLKYARSELNAALKHIEELRDKMVSDKNKERKAKRTLRWFDKASDNVKKELEDCVKYIPELNALIADLAEGELKTEHIRRRDDLIQREHMMLARSPLYADELRQDKQRSVEYYAASAESYQGIITKFEEEAARLRLEIAEKEAAGEV